MVWYLLFAHFLGDFVFQTDWMVRRRDNLWVLSLHAGIHSVLMFLLAGQLRWVLWPFILLLAMIHLIQDRIKNNLTKRRPDWIRGAFIIDQVLHYIAIWAVVSWFDQVRGSFSTPEKPIWVILAISYLLITYVWFISERVLNHSNTDYLQSIHDTKISRMLARAGFVSAFLLLHTLATTGMAFVLSNPYSQDEFRYRALLTDISVSISAIIFLIWALQ